MSWVWFSRSGCARSPVGALDQPREVSGRDRYVDRSHGIGGDLVGVPVEEQTFGPDTDIVGQGESPLREPETRDLEIGVGFEPTIGAKLLLDERGETGDIGGQILDTEERPGGDVKRDQPPGIVP